jgi:hypothetical protein
MLNDSTSISAFSLLPPLPTCCGFQLTFVQRSQQLYFVIHNCCDNTKKVRTCVLERLIFSSFKVKIYMITPFSQLNLGIVEHV